MDKDRGPSLKKTNSFVESSDLIDSLEVKALYLASIATSDLKIRSTWHVNALVNMGVCLPQGKYVSIPTSTIRWDSEELGGI